MRREEQLGEYRYRQSDTCFPLGRDSLLLGSFSTLRPRQRVCDLGCGGGALLLLLLGREPTLVATGVELCPADAALAQENLTRNGLPGEIIAGDLRALRALLPAGRFDLVVSNPPYYATGTGTSGGMARMEERCPLDAICSGAQWLLRNGGRFALVYPPERLCDLLACLRQHGLEPKRLQPIQHSITTPPSAVLVEAVRQGKPGLQFLPPLI